MIDNLTEHGQKVLRSEPRVRVKRIKSMARNGERREMSTQAEKRARQGECRERGKAKAEWEGKVG